jgi:hypothetical protein
MVSIEKVGETAGMVWKYLHENGKANLSAVERGVKAPKPVVHMAIGWLAREGKLALVEENRNVRVFLTDGQ